jgi:putative ABC transport system substrate-binding protein
MRRRDFTVGLLLAAAARTAGAQQPETKHRIAIVAAVVPAASITEADNFFWRAFFTELRRLGDIEGENLVVERYSAESHPERHAELARQAVSSHPDLIVAADNPIALTAQSATRTIPIAGLLWDPLKNGLVESLARPGGNLTGVSVDAGLELYAKGLQLLKEAVPSASRVAFLIMGRTWEGPFVQYMRDASRQLGVSLIEEPLAEGSSSAIAHALAVILRDRPDAVYFSANGEFYVHRRLVLDFLEKNRLPASFQSSEIVKEGGLMSYSIDSADLFRRWAGVVHQILAGAKPGEIPISQPTKFIFGVNLGTAKALGLTLSQSLLARADVVIA